MLWFHGSDMLAGLLSGDRSPGSPWVTMPAPAAPALRPKPITVALNSSMTARIYIKVLHDINLLLSDIIN